MEKGLGLLSNCYEQRNHDTKSLAVKYVRAVSLSFKLWINNRCNLFDCMTNNSTIITIILREKH